MKEREWQPSAWYTCCSWIVLVLLGVGFVAFSILTLVLIAEKGAA